MKNHKRTLNSKTCQITCSSRDSGHSVSAKLNETVIRR